MLPSSSFAYPNHLTHGGRWWSNVIVAKRLTRVFFLFFLFPILDLRESFFFSEDLPFYVRNRQKSLRSVVKTGYTRLGFRVLNTQRHLQLCQLLVDVEHLQRPFVMESEPRQREVGLTVGETLSGSPPPFVPVSHEIPADSPKIVGAPQANLRGVWVSRAFW